MKQLTLFDDYGPVLNIEQENTMTWLELYDFLTSQKSENPEFFNQQVIVYDVDTGDEYSCDTAVFSDNNQLVLSINNE